MIAIEIKGRYDRSEVIVRERGRGRQRGKLGGTVTRVSFGGRRRRRGWGRDGRCGHFGGEQRMEIGMLDRFIYPVVIVVLVGEKMVKEREGGQY